MTLSEAKEQSLKRWRKILADYPIIKLVADGQPDKLIYGKCGFCEYFSAQDCERICPLYPNICTPIETSHIALYWVICKNLEKVKPCKDLIEKMIKAIEEIK